MTVAAESGLAQTAVNVGEFISGPQHLNTSTFKTDEAYGYYEEATFSGNCGDDNQVGGMTFEGNDGKFYQNSYCYANIEVSEVIDNLFCLSKKATTDTSSYEQTIHLFDWCTTSSFSTASTINPAKTATTDYHAKILKYNDFQIEDYDILDQQCFSRANSERDEFDDILCEEANHRRESDQATLWLDNKVANPLDLDLESENAYSGITALTKNSFMKQPLDSRYPNQEYCIVDKTLLTELFGCADDQRIKCDGDTSLPDKRCAGNFDSDMVKHHRDYLEWDPFKTEENQDKHYGTSESDDYVCSVPEIAIANALSSYLDKADQDITLACSQVVDRFNLASEAYVNFIDPRRWDGHLKETNPDKPNLYSVLREAWRQAEFTLRSSKIQEQTLERLLVHQRRGEENFIDQQQGPDSYDPPAHGSDAVENPEGASDGFDAFRAAFNKHREQYRALSLAENKALKGDLVDMVAVIDSAKKFAEELSATQISAASHLASISVHFRKKLKLWMNLEEMLETKFSEVFDEASNGALDDEHLMSNMAITAQHTVSDFDAEVGVDQRAKIVEGEHYNGDGDRYDEKQSVEFDDTTGTRSYITSVKMSNGEIVTNVNCANAAGDAKDESKCDDFDFTDANHPLQSRDATCEGDTTSGFFCVLPAAEQGVNNPAVVEHRIVTDNNLGAGEKSYSDTAEGTPDHDAHHDKGLDTTHENVIEDKNRFNNTVQRLVNDQIKEFNTLNGQTTEGDSETYPNNMPEDSHIESVDAVETSASDGKHQNFMRAKYLECATYGEKADGTIDQTGNWEEAYLEKTNYICAQSECQLSDLSGGCTRKNRCNKAGLNPDTNLYWFNPAADLEDSRLFWGESNGVNPTQQEIVDCDYEVRQLCEDAINGDGNNIFAVEKSVNKNVDDSQFASLLAAVGFTLNTGTRCLESTCTLENDLNTCLTAQAAVPITAQCGYVNCDTSENDVEYFERNNAADATTCEAGKTDNTGCVQTCCVAKQKVSEWKADYAALSTDTTHDLYYSDVYCDTDKCDDQAVLGVLETGPIVRKFVAAETNPDSNKYFRNSAVTLPHYCAPSTQTQEECNLNLFGERALCSSECNLFANALSTPIPGKRCASATCNFNNNYDGDDEECCTQPIQVGTCEAEAGYTFQWKNNAAEAPRCADVLCTIDECFDFHYDPNTHYRDNNDGLVKERELCGDEDTLECAATDNNSIEQVLAGTVRCTEQCAATDFSNSDGAAGCCVPKVGGQFVCDVADGELTCDDARYECQTQAVIVDDCSELRPVCTQDICDAKNAASTTLQYTLNYECIDSSKGHDASAVTDHDEVSCTGGTLSWQVKRQENGNDGVCCTPSAKAACSRSSTLGFNSATDGTQKCDASGAQYKYDSNVIDTNTCANDQCTAAECCAENSDPVLDVLESEDIGTDNIPASGKVYDLVFNDGDDADTVSAVTIELKAGHPTFVSLAQTDNTATITIAARASGASAEKADFENREVSFTVVVTDVQGKSKEFSQGPVTQEGTQTPLCSSLTNPDASLYYANPDITRPTSEYFNADLIDESGADSCFLVRQLCSEAFSTTADCADSYDSSSYNELTLTSDARCVDGECDTTDENDRAQCCTITQKVVQCGYSDYGDFVCDKLTGVKTRERTQVFADTDGESSFTPYEGADEVTYDKLQDAQGNQANCGLDQFVDTGTCVVNCEVTLTYTDGDACERTDTTVPADGFLDTCELQFTVNDETENGPQNGGTSCLNAAKQLNGWTGATAQCLGCHAPSATELEQVATAGGDSTYDDPSGVTISNGVDPSNGNIYLRPGATLLIKHEDAITDTDEITVENPSGYVVISLAETCGGADCGALVSKADHAEGTLFTIGNGITEALELKIVPSYTGSVAAQEHILDDIKYTIAPRICGANGGGDSQLPDLSTDGTQCECNGQQDCFDICGGSAVRDVCDTCGGTAVQDCAGKCGEYEVESTCDTCVEITVPPTTVTKTTLYADSDGDGLGNSASSLNFCPADINDQGVATSGGVTYVGDNTDTDDACGLDAGGAAITVSTDCQTCDLVSADPNPVYELNGNDADGDGVCDSADSCPSDADAEPSDYYIDDADNNNVADSQTPVLSLCPADVDSNRELTREITVGDTTYPVGFTVTANNVVIGCMIAGHCNYNAEANVACNNGEADNDCCSGIPNSPCLTCNDDNSGLDFLDTDGDGLCDNAESSGCIRSAPADTPCTTCNLDVSGNPILRNKGTIDLDEIEYNSGANTVTIDGLTVSFGIFNTGYIGSGYRWTNICYDNLPAASGGQYTICNNNYGSSDITFNGVSAPTDAVVFMGTDAGTFDIVVIGQIVANAFVPVIGTYNDEGKYGFEAVTTGEFVEDRCASGVCFVTDDYTQALAKTDDYECRTDPCLTNPCGAGVHSCTASADYSSFTCECAVGYGVVPAGEPNEGTCESCDNDDEEYNNAADGSACGDHPGCASASLKYVYSASGNECEECLDGSFVGLPQLTAVPHHIDTCGYTIGCTDVNACSGTNWVAGENGEAPTVASSADDPNTLAVVETNADQCQYIDVLGNCGGGCDADADQDTVCDDVDECPGNNAIGASMTVEGITYCDCAENVLDLNGVCGGDCTEQDAVGVCGGTCATDADDDDVCDTVDLCPASQTIGLSMTLNPGTTSEITYCDCDGNVVDEIGVCGGSCAADIDGDGVCDDVDPCVDVDSDGVCRNGDDAENAVCDADATTEDEQCPGNSVATCFAAETYNFAIRIDGYTNVVNTEATTVWSPVGTGKVHLLSDGSVTYTDRDSNTGEVTSTDTFVSITIGQHASLQTYNQNRVITLKLENNELSSKISGDFVVIASFGAGSWTLTSHNPYESETAYLISGYDIGIEAVMKDLSCGCTDATACNFEASATKDDGSCADCAVQGCTDATACNYDVTATEDDGSCAGIPAGDCDCAGNVNDAIGVCGGTCADDTDSDGICDDVDQCVGTPDAIGECNGDCATDADGVAPCDCIDADGDGHCACTEADEASCDVGTDLDDTAADPTAAGARQLSQCILCT